MMKTLNAGDKAPGFDLEDQNGHIENTWYKISPKNTVSELRKVLG